METGPIGTLISAWDQEPLAHVGSRVEVSRHAKYVLGWRGGGLGWGDYRRFQASVWAFPAPFGLTSPYPQSIGLLPNVQMNLQMY